MKVKSKFCLLNKNKIAYLQIDLAFTLLIFIMFLFVIINMYNSKFYEQKQTNDYILVQSESEHICNLLISSSGVPNHWNQNLSTLVSIGLLDDGGINLSSNKLNVLNNSNYLDLTNNWNQNYFYHINIIGLKSGIDYVDFGFDNLSNNICSNYICYSNYNSEIVKVDVGVCK